MSRRPCGYWFCPSSSRESLALPIKPVLDPLAGLIGCASCGDHARRARVLHVLRVWRSWPPETTIEAAKPSWLTERQIRAVQ